MPSDAVPTFTLIGAGRAGGALGLALVRAGWRCRAVAGRAPERARAVAALLDAEVVPVAVAGAGADLVLLATPDAAVEEATAAALPAVTDGTLVVHCSGSRGPAAFGSAVAARPEVRFGVLHPLQTLPSAEAGAARLPGAWCAVAGPAEVSLLARELGMHPFAVERWTEYHAAACVASNHLVALLGQVERLAAVAAVPFDAFVPLVRATVDNVIELGPADALTGPVARGDAETVRAHLAALPEEERPAYRALAREALRLLSAPRREVAALLEAG